MLQLTTLIDQFVQTFTEHQLSWIVGRVNPETFKRVIVVSTATATDTTLTGTGRVGWLVVFRVPSTARSFKDGTPIYAPCEGREARFIYRSHRESNPGSLRGSPLHNHCATPAPPGRDGVINYTCDMTCKCSSTIKRLVGPTPQTGTVRCGGLHKAPNHTDTNVSEKAHISSFNPIVYFKRLDSRQINWKCTLSVFGHGLNGYDAKLIHGVLRKNDRRLIHYIWLTLKYSKVWLLNVLVFIVPHVACFKWECGRFL